MHIKVLWIIDVAKRAVRDAIYDSGLEVEQDGAWDVARIVGLVEEDIFAVTAGMRALGGVRMKVAVLVNAVFQAELLPELGADWRGCSVHVSSDCGEGGGRVYRCYRIGRLGR